MLPELFSPEGCSSTEKFRKRGQDGRQAEGCVLYSPLTTALFQWETHQSSHLRQVAQRGHIPYRKTSERSLAGGIDFAPKEGV